MKIPIESKHVYDNSLGAETIAQYGSYNQSASGTYGVGQIVRTTNIKLLWSSNDFRLTPGVDADGGLIGDKIMLKSVYLEFIHKLTNNVSTSSFPAGGATSQNPTYAFGEPPSNISGYQLVNNKMWRRDFRFFIVHFNDTKILELSPSELSNPTDPIMTETSIKRGLARWFNQVWVPNNYNSSATYENDGYASEMSNKSELMRESTTNNGTFRKIKDQSYSLSADHNYQVIKLQLDPHKQLNFKPDANDSDGRWAPTNDWYANTFAFIITPSNYALDMDPVSGNYYFNTQSFQSPINESTVYRKVKYTYYDV